MRAQIDANDPDLRHGADQYGRSGPSPSSEADLPPGLPWTIPASLASLAPPPPAHFPPPPAHFPPSSFNLHENAPTSGTKLGSGDVASNFRQGGKFEI